MSTLEEVRRTVRTITDAGNRQFALLHCVSSYPAPAGSANLRAMEALRREFGCLVGFSDHTLGREVALAAAALGANILEKHITLDRTLPGPDHGASMEPEEFAQMIAGIRAVESALGDGVKRPAACEEELAEAARRSLVAAQRIPRGAVLIEKHVVVLRPGTGLAPAMRSQIIGRRAKRDIAAGELFALEMLE
jgi:sialic acid synthase SpsE